MTLIINILYIIGVFIFKNFDEEYGNVCWDHYLNYTILYTIHMVRVKYHSLICN